MTARCGRHNRNPRPLWKAAHDTSKETMSKTPTITEPEDPVESMLKKTGCINLHYKVQVENRSVLHLRWANANRRNFIRIDSISDLLIFFYRSALQRHKTGASVKTLWRISKTAWPNTVQSNARNTNKISQHINLFLTKPNMSRFFRKLLHRVRVVAFLDEPTKMALVVRGDLKMTKGKTGAQCAHAAIICFESAFKQRSDLLNAWMSVGQPKIVLRVDSLKQMEEIVKSANERNIINGVVRDAGKTQVAAGTVTVLGLGPDTVSNIDSLVKHLRLLWKWLESNSVIRLLVKQTT